MRIMPRPNSILQVFLLSLAVKSIVFLKALNWYGGDEFYYISRGMWLARGYTPVSDFYNPYGIGMVLLFAPIHLVLDSVSSFYALRLASLLISCVNICIIYLLAEKLYSRQAGWVSVITYLFTVTSLKTSVTVMSETYMVFFLLAGYFLIYVRRADVLSSLSFAFALSLKPYFVLFLALPLAYLMFSRRLGKKFFISLMAFTFVFYAPYLYIMDDVVTNYDFFYMKSHGGARSILTEWGIAGVLVFAVVALVYYPMACFFAGDVFESIKGRMRIRWNAFHLWFASTVFFLFFSNIYVGHHLLMTLPAACIISAPRLYGFSKKAFPKWPYLFVLAFALFSGVFIHSSEFESMGFIDLERARLDPVVDYVKTNSGPGDLILQDYAVYGYLADVGDVTLSGWHFGYGVFEKDDVIRVIEDTHPRYIVVSSNYTYPAEMYDYLGDTYVQVPLNGTEFPRLYITGFEDSTEIRGYFTRLLRGLN